MKDKVYRAFSIRAAPRFRDVSYVYVCVYLTPLTFDAVHRSLISLYSLKLVAGKLEWS